MNRPRNGKSRSLSRWLARVPVAALVIGLAACGATSTSTGASSQAPQETTNAAPSTTPARATGPSVTAVTMPANPAANAATLQKLLVTTVPAGFTRQTDSVGDTGPADLTKAVHDDGTSDAKSVLSVDGFVYGYQGLWQSTDGKRQIIVFLYQFASPEGAKSYSAHAARIFQSNQAQLKTTTFTVPGIMSATGVAGTAQSTSAAIVLYAKKAYFVQVVANGPEASGLATVANSVAATQFGRL